MCTGYAMGMKYNKPLLILGFALTWPDIVINLAGDFDAPFVSADISVWVARLALVGFFIMLFGLWPTATNLWLRICFGFLMLLTVVGLYLSFFPLA